MFDPLLLIIKKCFEGCYVMLCHSSMRDWCRCGKWDFVGEGGGGRFFLNLLTIFPPTVGMLRRFRCGSDFYLNKICETGHKRLQYVEYN